MAFVLQDDPHAGIQEGQLAQAGFQRLEAVVEIAERPIRPVGLGRGQEAHFGPATPRGRADLMHVDGAISILEPGAVFGVVAPDGQLQPFAQRVDDRDAHAVQTARDLVGVAAVVRVVEFPAGVELGHDDLGSRNAFLGMHVDRDPTAVVADGNAVVGMDFHHDFSRMTGQRLINAIVHDFVDHVVQARAIVGVADIHAGALANRLQPLENFDRISAIFGRILGLFSHASETLFVARDL